MAAVLKETQNEHGRNGQSRNMSFPGTNEDYITQVFGVSEGWVSKKKLSQEISRTKSRVLGAQSK